MEPSGARTSSRVCGSALPVTAMLTRVPATPANVMPAFCPAPSEIVSGAPPTVMLPVRSTGTPSTCTVALPTAAPCGSIAIV